MRRFFGAIRRFFLPPADAKTFQRVLPVFSVAFLVILLFAFANFAWEESNLPSFCGLTCHTMPPEYVTYQQSAHTNVSCEDCHMGRDRLPVMIQRKVKYSWQTGTAMIFNTYEYPIVAKNMAPAREACENCHKPEKFSADKLVEIRNYAQDETNTATSVFLSLKIGGGTERQGLGYGIHWHIENPVYFYTTDKEQQNIPYVVVKHNDGTQTEYVDVQSNFDPSTVNQGQMVEMDCITCHNRTSHLIASPSNTLDDLMMRGLVSPKIPEIKKKAVEVMSVPYTTEQAAMDAISGLTDYYKTQQADFYTSNTALVDSAVQILQQTWKNTNFLDQKVNWQTHPDNIGHQDSPGCFRCHDGKHIAQDGAKEVSVSGAAPNGPTAGTIRLECNLCHSIPVVSSPNQMTASLTLNKGFEPDSHKSVNWISLHRDVYSEQACSGCHKTDDPGGVSNTSFCSNSACHGATWKFAGFDAPQLRAALSAEVQSLITPTAVPTSTPTITPTLPPTPTFTVTPTREVAPDTTQEANSGEATPTAEAATPTAEAASTGSAVTYTKDMQPIFESTCGTCHGGAAMMGLNLTTYETIMKGSANGPVVVAGDPENSKIVKVQSAGDHPGQLTPDQLELLKQWIKDGALEK